MRLFLLGFALLTACATTPDDGARPGGIPIPQGDGGKGDGAIACGSDACDASLCAWNCATAGTSCTPACTTELRKEAFVAASVTGAVSTSVDSRTTPYVPRLALDNVLIYGCEFWHFSDGTQGLEIELTELIHSSFTVDPSDPSRYQRKLDVYIAGLQGVGSYKAEASFEAASGGTRYVTKDGCSVDLQSDRGGLAGSFQCDLSGAMMSGQFSCPGNALDTPIFVAWTPGS